MCTDKALTACTGARTTRSQAREEPIYSSEDEDDSSLALEASGSDNEQSDDSVPEAEAVSHSQVRHMCRQHCCVTACNASLAQTRGRASHVSSNAGNAYGPNANAGNEYGSNDGP